MARWVFILDHPNGSPDQSALGFLGLQGFQQSRQAALVTSGGAAMNDAFVDHRINDRHSGSDRAVSARILTLFKGATRLLDGGAHLRAQRHVMGATLDGLTGALFCRLDIGQGKNPQRRSNEPCILLNYTNSVNFVFALMTGAGWLFGVFGGFAACFDGLCL
jgi:hypothetical protein